jgi:hypothetical protein
MMNRIALLTLSLGLASAPAFADEAKQTETKPASNAIQMTDAQLDNVSAGALINAFVVDVVDVQNVDVAVAIPVNAQVAANVLGGAAGAAGFQQPGRIFQ